MNVLESLLLSIANLLYYPVIIGVLFVLAHQCVAIGKHLNDLKQRGAGLFKQQKILRKQVDSYLRSPSSSIKTVELDLISILRNWYQQYSKTFNQNRLVIKAGPALGLMGTLIPMGTALSSLSQGDLMIMSANMVTAFTTTVIGMASGLSAFLLYQKQSEWMKQDLLLMEGYIEKQLIELEEGILKEN